MFPPITCSYCSEPLLQINYGDTPFFSEGLLKCENCQTYAPVTNGILYYTELDIAYHSNERDFFDSFKINIEQKRSDYLSFIDNKICRNLIDPYSAFQPFNESSRSFYPFIHDLKTKVLNPGDAILDTWCRTGWTGFFLASLFPEQLIISLWEGNKDVLGYAGFDYWYAKDMRPENLVFLHVDINKRLPFTDNTFSLVYGLDTLHRYDQTSLVSELLRVTKEEGVLTFPHIHLTNSEPVPFFERGEKQIHGTDWERFFNQRLNRTYKKAYLLSEPQLFDLKEKKPLRNVPNTSDYNGLIAIIPENLTWNIAEYKPSFHDNDRVIVNPYLKVNLNQATVNIDHEYLNGAVGKMLERHPIYQKRVEGLIDFSLSSQEVQIVYLAQNNNTVLEISNQLNLSRSSLIPIMERLSESEIIHILPLTEEAVNLQLFHSAIPFLPKKDKQTLFHLRHGLIQSADDPVIIDLAEECELEADDISYLTSKIKSHLINQGVEKGDCIFICTKPHFESLLVLWSAFDLGIEVSVISTEVPVNTKIELFKEREAKFLFLNVETYLESVDQIQFGIPIVFDAENDQVADERYFSNWIDSASDDSIGRGVIPQPDDIAVTLYSSGTTGKPKGIRLSHGALLKSGKVFSETYQWDSQDKVMMVTELDSMSGLRNIAIATIFSGSSIVIASMTGHNKILSIIEGINKSNVTILTCTPALIKQFINLGDRIKGQLSSLRQVLCTGGNLSSVLVTQFNDLFNIRILNYYGLTETSGLCIGETPDFASVSSAGSIGIPIDSVAQIVDESNNLVKQGEVGHLRIFNDRLMDSYLQQTDNGNLVIEDGWLYTGDLAMQTEQGAFVLKGRERNIIKDVAGNIIYLSEVENVLLTHPDIQDVYVAKQEVDEIESLVALIIPKESLLVDRRLEDEIKSFVRQKIGSTKVPSVQFVNELKRDSRGNVDHNRTHIIT